jgi:hypothetical protein
MQPDDVHSPIPKIVEIMISETVVRVKCIEIRMKWINFVDCVHSMIDGISIILINKHRVVGIDSDG